MPQIRLRPFMARDNGHFGPSRQARGRKQRCRNVTLAEEVPREPQFAIAGAAQIMKLNSVGPGGIHART
jgi:hypothetical protein